MPAQGNYIHLINSHKRSISSSEICDIGHAEKPGLAETITTVNPEIIIMNNSHGIWKTSAATNFTERSLMNIKTLACAITGAALVLSVGSAFAVTIYDESASGDLDAIGTTNVNLVSGVNEILGSIPGTPPADTDRIKFTQVANLIVDSITLSFTSSFDPLGLGTQFNLDLHNDQANLFDDNFLVASTGAPISASFFDSFGPETGPLTQTTFGTIWDFQISPGTVYPYQDWKLTINTSVVPLPAAVWLFGSGLLGLVGIARRKKAA